MIKFFFEIITKGNFTISFGVIHPNEGILSIITINRGLVVNGNLVLLFISEIFLHISQIVNLIYFTIFFKSLRDFPENQFE